MRLIKPSQLTKKTKRKKVKQANITFHHIRVEVSY